MKRMAALVGTLIALAMVQPGFAVAQTSRHPSAAAALPFTRLDLLLLVAGAAALIGAGLVVRQVAGRLR